MPPPSLSGPGPEKRVITEEQAVDEAFRLCSERALQVDRVERASLDADGRWHVTLVGYSDRAQMMLDGEDGKLLKGRFRRGEPSPSPSPGAPPYPGSSAGAGPQPPPGPPPPKEPDDLDLD